MDVPKNLLHNYKTMRHIANELSSQRRTQTKECFKNAGANAVSAGLAVGLVAGFVMAVSTAYEYVYSDDYTKLPEMSEIMMPFNHLMDRLDM